MRDHSRRICSQTNARGSWLAAGERKFGWLRGALKFFAQQKFGCGGLQPELLAPPSVRLLLDT